MGGSYLIDTNAVIDLLAGKLPNAGSKWVDKIVLTEDTYLSVINKIELLGFNGSSEEMGMLREFVESLPIIPITDEVAEKPIEIRSARKIKLPDAILAASALLHNLTLVTRNTKDFEGIEGLSIVNPHHKI